MLQQLTSYHSWPIRYTHSYIHLMPQTPHTLFAYWEVQDRRKQFIAEHYQTEWQALTKLLRLTQYHSSSHDVKPIDYMDVFVTDQDSWYFHHLKSNACYRIEYGIWNAEQQFISLLQSELAVTPRTESILHKQGNPPPANDYAASSTEQALLSSIELTNANHSPFDQFSTYTLYSQPSHTHITITKECNHDISS